MLISGANGLSAADIDADESLRLRLGDGLMSGVVVVPVADVVVVEEEEEEEEGCARGGLIVMVALTAASVTVD
jgi:hypothetical protein